MSNFMSSRKEILITGKYKVIRRIGGGSFGDIYLAINIANGEILKFGYGEEANMPRHYKRKVGNRKYVDYSKEQLAQCLAKIRSKSLTQRAAAELYGISRSTLKLKLKKIDGNKPGHPTVFTEDEENSFVAHITALSEFGFPLNDVDLQFIVKDPIRLRQIQYLNHY